MIWLIILFIFYLGYCCGWHVRDNSKMRKRKGCYNPPPINECRPSKVPTPRPPEKVYYSLPIDSQHIIG